MQMPLAIQSGQDGCFDPAAIREYLAENSPIITALRRQIATLVGDADSEVFYRSGARDAARFIGAGGYQSIPEADRFRAIISHYSDMGLGCLEVESQNIDRGWAVVIGRNTFESRDPATEPRRTPACAYLAGAIAAALRETA